MESSYKRFNNIGEDEGSLVTPTSHDKVSNGSDPLQFGTNINTSDPNWSNGGTDNILRPKATHVPTPTPAKKNNEDFYIQQTQRVRLRALETETEYFLRLLNVTSIKRLLWAQMTACSVILVGQVLLYAFAQPGSWKVVDYSGMGIWAPVFIFSVASGLTLLAVKSPGGCILGTGMGFQIASAVLAGILTFLASISLMMHGRWDYMDEKYNPEVGGRIICSFMIFGAVVMVITGIFISVQFCRATCCGRSRATESFLFDVDTIKV